MSTKPALSPRITPFLWFDHQAEDAARFYTGVFPNSKVKQTSHYTDAGQDVHGRTPGSVMVVAFELDGQALQALNGGPMFSFNPAVSLVVHCDTQAEIDHYWAALGEGGNPATQQCGWLADRYGLSWQIVPRAIGDWMSGDAAAAGRVMAAMLGMKKLDLPTLKKAHEGAGI